MNQKNIYDIIIIGSGVSGLFFASGLGKKVNGLILNQAKTPGLKLLMSGGGSCNLTHSGSIKDFTDCYFENGKKIRGCLYKYSNISLMEFFQSRGLKLLTRDDGKVFPNSMKAKDVLDLLLEESRKNGFELKNNCKVTAISPGDEYHIVVAGNDKLCCKYLVIASGGCSYPTTGSDGSMFSIIKTLPGVKVEPLHPSLAPIYVKNYPYSELSGISFPGAEGSIYRDEKKIASITGDLLLTDRCFSGPLALHLSREANPNDKLIINYLGNEFDMSYKKKISKLLAETKSKPSTVLSKEFTIPKKFSDCIDKRASGKASEIASMLLSDSFDIEYPGGFNKAMATRGGISLSSVSTKSFELKSCDRIYALGEVLDVDAMTGGYNIQFAYSSAMAAAASVLEKL